MFTLSPWQAQHSTINPHCHHLPATWLHCTTSPKREGVEIMCIIHWKGSTILPFSAMKRAEVKWIVERGVFPPFFRSNIRTQRVVLCLLMQQLHLAVMMWSEHNTHLVFRPREYFLDLGCSPLCENLSLISQKCIKGSYSNNDSSSCNAKSHMSTEMKERQAGEAEAFRLHRRWQSKKLLWVVNWRTCTGVFVIPASSQLVIQFD